MITSALCAKRGTAIKFILAQVIREAWRALDVLRPGRKGVAVIEDVLRVGQADEGSCAENQADELT
jgi:hypothetical protein